MEIKNKKLYLYALISVFTFVLFLGQTNASEYINYYEISMTSQQYNNLLNLGFSEDEIYYMSEDTFELNKDIESNLVAKDEKFYKTLYTDVNGNIYSAEITKDEYENQSSINPRGTVSTTYKTMVTTMSKLTNTFRYKVSLAWNNFPSTRSYDITGIGFEDDVYISSGLYHGYNYCFPNGDCTSSSQYYYRQTTSTGASVVHKLPSSDDIISLGSYLYYDVSKNTTDTITRLDMYGDYAHATSNVNYSIYSNHVINAAGIGLGSGISYYDAIPCAQSTWGGSW